MLEEFLSIQITIFFCHMDGCKCRLMGVVVIEMYPLDSSFVSICRLHFGKDVKLV